MLNNNNKKEIEVFLKYMINHNSSHLDELEEVSLKIKEIDLEAYEIIKSSFDDFKNGNEKIQKSLDLILKD